MEYKYNNIESGDKLKTIIKKSVETFTNTVLETYGPKGNTVVVYDLNMQPYATKDGVTVAKNIEGQTPIEDAFFKMLKEVAEKTLKEAGDGTTTSILLAGNLIKLALELDLENKEIIKELDNLFKDTITHLNNKKYKINDDLLKHVASISTNGNKEMSEIIFKAYKHSENVVLDKGETNSDILEFIDGYTLNSSYIDDYFITNNKDESVEIKDSLFIISKDKFTFPIMEKLAKKNNHEKHITIIGPDFDKQLIDAIKANKLKYITLLKLPGIGGHRDNLMRDIIEYHECKNLIFDRTIQKNIWYSNNVKHIEAFRNKIVINHPIKKETKEKYIKKYKDRINNTNDEYSIRLLKDRLNIFESSSSRILVGGNSELEIKEKFDRYDDAVKAVHCALEEGIVEGAGKTLSEISKVIDNKFSSILEIPKKIINVESKDYIKDGIVDPVKVIKVALTNAISVTKNIVTTNSIVLPKELWN